MESSSSAPEGEITVGGVSVARGDRRRLEIPVSRLPTETWLSIPVEVVNGAQPGPRLWLSAAVHGDELNGVEIIREVLERLDPARLVGSVVAVPIVNVFGFIQQSRYLPDRRDLNRTFPGTARGSLASRLAHLFMTEIVTRSTHGVDFHTGSNHRTNLPQIRANLSDAETRRCAEAFGAPLLLDAGPAQGTLREAASRQGIAALLYEAGEPLRFDPDGIRIGVAGVMRLLSTLKMWPEDPPPVDVRPVEVTSSTWVRARRSGILRLDVTLGRHVAAKEPLGEIADAFGGNSITVVAPEAGIVIGHTNNPLVHQGDALVHVATRKAQPGPE